MFVKIQGIVIVLVFVPPGVFSALQNIEIPQGHFSCEQKYQNYSRSKLLN